MRRVWHLYGHPTLRRAIPAFALLTAFVTGSRIGADNTTVNAGGDLQAATNAAKPGDTIFLQPGATFTGNYTLPAKSGSAYITIRSAALDSALPPAGVRITPAYAAQLPKIRSTSSFSVVVAGRWSRSKRMSSRSQARRWLRM